MTDAAADDEMQAVVLTKTDAGDQHRRRRCGEDRLGLIKRRGDRHVRRALELRRDPGGHAAIAVNDENRRRLHH